MKILIADDEPAVLDLNCRLMRLAGFEVVPANDGDEACNAFRSAPFPLVLTDLEMPCMDGFELITQVRENEKFKQIPIIILTTEGKKDMVMKGLTLGANSFLQKPIKPDLMLQEVERLLGKKTGGPGKGA